MILSILLPHLRNPGNDQALHLALEMLQANTDSEYVLCMDTTTSAPLLPRMNRLVKDAPTECCVITSSDIFLAPHWDTLMLEAYAPEVFVTGVVVEPGVLGVHEMNYGYNFGSTPGTFKRDRFETFAATEVPTLKGDGWVVPYMFHRDRWLSLGGLNNEAGDLMDVPADEVYFREWKAAGNRIVRTKSCAYHLQRWSSVKEQEDGKRQ